MEVHIRQTSAGLKMLIATDILKSRVSPKPGSGPSLIGRNWFEELGISIISPVHSIEGGLPEEVTEFKTW